MQRLCAKIFPNDDGSGHAYDHMHGARCETSSLLCLRRVSCGLPAAAEAEPEVQPAAPANAVAAPAVPHAAGGVPEYPRAVLRDMSRQPCHVIPLRGVDVVKRPGRPGRGPEAAEDVSAALRWLVSPAPGPGQHCPGREVAPSLHPVACDCKLAYTFECNVVWLLG